MTNSSSAASVAEELLRERDRVVRRLGSMALAAVPTARVLAAAQQLADLVADATDAPRRTVPILVPYAAGDQITVLVGEVRAADLPAGAAEALGRAATGVLADLRRVLAGP